MRTILVADDNETCRDSILKVLAREGYNVQGVPDADTALAAMHVRTFDLVVCDYRMPGKTGLDLLAELKREFSGVPVLMISACADLAVEQRALELGATELMRKPIRRQELVDSAAKAIGGGYDGHNDVQRPSGDIS